MAAAASASSEGVVLQTLCSYEGALVAGMEGGDPVSAPRSMLLNKKKLILKAVR